jgi:trk system potassium uptake protein TrkH
MREVKLIFKPNTLIPISVAGNPVPGFVSSSVAGFVILYFLTLLLGSLALAVGGADLITAATAALACLGNIGPGFAAVGPTQNFAHFSPPEKILLVLLMWLGRLEILAITAVFTRTFWRR